MNSIPAVRVVCWEAHPGEIKADEGLTGSSKENKPCHRSGLLDHKDAALVDCQGGSCPRIRWVESPTADHVPLIGTPGDSTRKCTV